MVILYQRFQYGDRRYQNWGGNPSPSGLLRVALPSWLQLHVDIVNSSGVFEDVEANHVAIEEYPPGSFV